MSENIEQEYQAPLEISKYSSGSYAWIINEDLLRDEGVIYGISESNPNEKIQTIKDYFQEKISNLEKDIELFESNIEEMKQGIDGSKNEVDQMQDTRRELSTTFASEYNVFFRLLIGVVAYLSMLIFNFYLIFNWLKDDTGIPLIMTLGCYFFGILSLFGSSSYLYTSDHVLFNSEVGKVREKWKVLLEELGIPFVATFFIIALGCESKPVIDIIAYALLIYFLFLFAGKGFLNITIRLRDHFLVFKSNNMHNQFRKKELEETQRLITKKEEEIEGLKKVVEQKVDQKNSKLLEVENTIKKCETTISYFMSEFSLARATKKSLSNKELASFLSKNK